MGQVIFFALFIIVGLAGAFVYFSPTQKAINSIKYEKSVNDGSAFNPDELLTRKRDLQVEMKMTGGDLHIFKEIDDLTQEKKKFTDLIEGEKQRLKNIKQEISNISSKTDKNDQDLLKLKDLGLQMQDEEHLLIIDGQQLTKINDQLTQYRQLLTDQNNLVNISNQSSLESLQQHNDTVNDKASMFVDKVSQQSDDAARHSRDEQQDIQQHMADEQQRIRDQQNR